MTDALGLSLLAALAFLHVLALAIGDVMGGAMEVHRATTPNDPTASFYPHNKAPAMTCTVDGCARPAFCRGLCRRDYARQWRANPPSLTPKTCRHCGTAYTSRRPTYCSADCRMAAHLAAQRDRRTRHLVCPTCSHAFAGQPGQRYCGLACRPHRRYA